MGGRCNILLDYGDITYSMKLTPYFCFCKEANQEGKIEKGEQRCGTFFMCLSVGGCLLFFFLFSCINGINSFCVLITILPDKHNILCFQSRLTIKKILSLAVIYSAYHLLHPVSHFVKIQLFESSDSLTVRLKAQV